MKSRRALVVGALASSILLASYLGCQRAETPNPPPESRLATADALPAGAIPITISSTVPDELNKAGGGAPGATIQQAAAFAWQEFIALNWPAVNQTGGIVNNAFVKQRDMPDNNCQFGDPKCAAQPLVWETFRGKVEIFPGDGNPPPGYPSVAQGDDSFGYDALPTYNYGSPVLPCNQASPAASPTPVPSFINLDETDQITLDSMFAGVAPTTVNGNASPQLIRFLAKANRLEYTYVTSPGNSSSAQWWEGPPPLIVTNTKAYLAKNQTSPPAGSHDYVSLPNGTIELKAGWRVLNPTEISSRRFKTATVRHYENANNPCYSEDTFGLVALHIIQKTQSAPYFIYATFEQADNIMTPSASPTPIEDVDGNINKALIPPCRSDQTPGPCPTTPSVTLQDTPIVSTKTPPLPPQISLVPASAQYCTPSTATTPVGQIYYLNAAGKSGLPSAGFVCVNYRDNAIPQPVIDANKTAHAAIKSYNQTHGIADSPWLYYKLVNVQYQPIDKNYAGVYTGNDPNSNKNPANYHLANILVETNRTLQLFSGSLLGTGSNSDYDSQFGGPPGTAIHKNVYYGGAQYNMGGCMGCHGSQGQHQGGDFSVILANGSVGNPEVPAPVTPSGAAQIRRNRLLKY